MPTLLGDIYSWGDRAKRTLSDALRDPSGFANLAMTRASEDLGGTPDERANQAAYWRAQAGRGSIMAYDPAIVQQAQDRTSANAQKLALALMAIKDIPAPSWNTQRQSLPVGINPTPSEMRQLFKDSQVELPGEPELRLLMPRGGAGDVYAWPAGGALHSDVGSFFQLNPRTYQHAYAVPPTAK